MGSIVVRNVGGSGLLLNDSTNVEVGLVDAVGAGTGSGYAAFRMANDNGAVDGGYLLPTSTWVRCWRAAGPRHLLRHATNSTFTSIRGDEARIDVCD